MKNPLVVELAYDGLCTFEFGVAVEIFGLARPEMGDDWYRFAVAGIDKGELSATGGIRFAVDGGLELLEKAGTIHLRLPTDSLPAERTCLSFVRYSGFTLISQFN